MKKPKTLSSKFALMACAALAFTISLGTLAGCSSSEKSTDSPEEPAGTEQETSASAEADKDGDSAPVDEGDNCGIDPDAYKNYCGMGYNVNPAWEEKETSVSMMYVIDGPNNIQIACSDSTLGNEQDVYQFRKDAFLNSDVWTDQTWTDGKTGSATADSGWELKTFEYTTNATTASSGKEEKGVCKAAIGMRDDGYVIITQNDPSGEFKELDAMIKTLKPMAPQAG